MINIEKLIDSKSMKYRKNADTLLLLLLFTTTQPEKSIEKTLFVSTDALNRLKPAGLGVLYHNIYQILKLNF